MDPACLEGQKLLEQGYLVGLDRRPLLQPRAISLEHLRHPRQLQAPTPSSPEHLHSVSLSQVIPRQILQSPLLRAFSLNPILQTTTMLQQPRPALVVASLACRLNQRLALRQLAPELLVIFSGGEVSANPPQHYLPPAQRYLAPPTKRPQRLRQTLQQQEPVYSVVYPETKTLKRRNQPHQLPLPLISSVQPNLLKRRALQRRKTARKRRT
ncbi:hypothetical protein M413DRAFT_300991 [Hebeloma cylindrosporum]|uniref:Uncharacterized protein n=1 Tax=Hebeloma cylindrosporum TaxID=76867 RepID=A0A0C3CPJ9_HEBCY|nr:hypothetical protein M413DRAFT_300991 [Hebeloma cylindrosporum h7]